MSWRLNLAPVATCHRAKRRYHAKAEADAHAAFVERCDPSPPGKGRLSSYWCDACSAWHVGHDTAGPGKPRRTRRGVGGSIC